MQLAPAAQRVAATLAADLNRLQNLGSQAAFRSLTEDLGAALSPFNAFMILTGIETLPLRMQRHSENALAVAQFLADHPAVKWVSYPGLKGDRYYNLAQKYCPRGCGAVFTFGLKGGYDAGLTLVKNLQLFSHLANVGDTRSLIIHPASTTHRQLTEAWAGGVKLLVPVGKAMGASRVPVKGTMFAEKVILPVVLTSTSAALSQ